MLKLFSKIETDKEAQNIIDFFSFIYGAVLILTLISKFSDDKWEFAILDFLIGIIIIILIQKYRSRIAAIFLLFFWPLEFIIWCREFLFNNPIIFLLAILYLYVGVRTCQVCFQFNKKTKEDFENADDLSKS